MVCFCGGPIQCALTACTNQYYHVPSLHTNRVLCWDSTQHSSISFASCCIALGPHSPCYTAAPSMYYGIQLIAYRISADNISWSESKLGRDMSMGMAEEKPATKWRVKITSLKLYFTLTFHSIKCPPSLLSHSPLLPC